jgi:hypothetical protein
VFEGADVFEVICTPMGEGLWWVELNGEIVTNHRVQISEADHIRFGEADPAALLTSAFKYLAEALGQEHIHKEFDLDSMSFYLPDFESEVKDRLQ